MIQVEQYMRKKVLVLGLAKSGVSAAKLLQKLGAFVTVNDTKPLTESEEAQELLEAGITVICGCHPVALLDEGFELVVKNPGIPYSNPMVERATELSIPIITEVELAYEVSEAPFIAITGSNGKTTTTTLIYEMLMAGAKNPLIAGNIGTVASEVAQIATKENIIVIEMSSFQLMGIRKFHPHIAVFTNLYDAHLDYHGTSDEYFRAKLNITKNQSVDDYFIYNGSQQVIVERSARLAATKVAFAINQSTSDNAEVSIQDGNVCFRGEPVLEVKKIVLPGSHNLENVLAAISAAKLVGVDNAAIEKVLTSFNGVEHRLEFVRELNGRRFYNDSKATNITAASTALAAFSAPTILLAGGLDRGNEFDDLKPALKNVKALVTFGETAEKLSRIASEVGIEKILVVENVAIAAAVAYQQSNDGDIILLSPACASWDQHKTFEDRGHMYINAVQKL